MKNKKDILLTAATQRARMTDENRVERALASMANVIEDERLNFAETLAVAERIITNVFGNAADAAGDPDALQAIIDIAEQFLRDLVAGTTDTIGTADHGWEEEVLLSRPDVTRGSTDK